MAPGGEGWGNPGEGSGTRLSLSPQQSLLTMEEIDSVEETQVKERKCILLRIRGGKQFVLQCDVSVPPWLLATSYCLLAIPPAAC